MFTKSLASFLVLGTVLAACADTSRTIAAPDVAPAHNDVSTDIGFGATADGPMDVYFGDPSSSTQLSVVSSAAAAQAGTSGRASGHVGFNFAGPTFGLLNERYSFTAHSTGAAPGFTAKGQFEMMLTAASGVEQRFHGDVICMSTVGNTTRLAGQLTKVWINNVQRPITGATHVIWTVVDNGEGQGATDTASPMFFNNATNAQNHCTVGFSPVQFPNGSGNVQVQP